MSTHQGREADVSSPQFTQQQDGRLGFVSDSRRLNVAITAAVVLVVVAAHCWAPTSTGRSAIPALVALGQLLV
jgi:hypothetical protein